jgi:hypothetical protein
MMIHHMLSVARRATPPSGASLMPNASTGAKPDQPAPSPAFAEPESTYRPAPSLPIPPATDAESSSQVSLPAALAAYQEFSE